MHAVRELTAEELTAVCGGATNNGSLPRPAPSPVEQIVKWILSHL
jgi:hypothetical protein